MNCAEFFVERARERPEAPAVWLPGSGTASFGDLLAIGAGVQRRLRESGVGPGDAVLVAENLGPTLYGIVIGLLGLGVSILLVEPWMPVSRIESVVAAAAPRAFVAGMLGMLWGLRVRAVRRIPSWFWTWRMRRGAAGPLAVESLDADHAAIVTFTSGTTGLPKGVVRRHGGLRDQHGILTRALGLEGATGTDLTIFANFVLLNLASGRGSIVVPPAWRERDLSAIDALPDALQPRSATCGPAFLRRLVDRGGLPKLEHLHVGGALTDVPLFEAAFRRWPDARVMHVYGSSEAEPVAAADARRCVAESRARGFFQTLHLGAPVAEVRSDVREEGVWVAGPHVCSRYVGNEEENRTTKRTDAEGRVWHFMGDRVTVDGAGWWYAGRSGQTPEEFRLEQRIYARLQTSACFVHRRLDGALALVGEGVGARAAEVRTAFPGIAEVLEAVIVRDRRHRARIDREGTLKKRG